MTTLGLSIDGERISRHIQRLAGFSDAPSPAVTRVLFTPADLQARRFVRDLMEEVGLRVRQDPAGNLFGRWEGAENNLPPVATGSHCDAIPHSGRYDGTVGVLGGLEAIRALREVGFRPRRPIELIMFTSEEPTRYGIGCLGSRLMSGNLAPHAAAALRDATGETFETTRTNVGCTGPLVDVRLPKGSYKAFVELHIEQGPLLEREGIPIGVVTGITAPSALQATFTGEGGHAGSVLMAVRKDALLPAAELVLEVERAALELGGEDTVATVGVLNVHPGASNSIPSHCEIKIDVRDLDVVRRDTVLVHIQEKARALGSRRGIETKVELINADPPANCDAGLIAAIEAGARDAALKYKRLISRAYHDSLFMAIIAPTAMIFIPCRDGVSHRPDEYSSPAAISAGVEVLARSLAALATQ